MAKGSFASGNLYYYPEYHHWLTHGLPGALGCSILLAVFARRRRRVFWLSFLTFHLHLLCDLVGSRGPDKNDLWPIFYFGPITHHPAPDVDLEIPMAAGWLTKFPHYPGVVRVVSLAGDGKRPVLHRPF
jgi:hypothetical protein